MINLETLFVGRGARAACVLGEESLLILVVQGLPSLGEAFLKMVVPPLPLFPDPTWVQSLGERLLTATSRASAVNVMQFVYAAVFADNDEVIVSHAGDVRVELQQGETVRQTRDHILLNRASGDQLPDGDIEMLLEVLPTTVTRWIGPECAAQPEITRWKSLGKYDLVVATADIHHHESPLSRGPSEHTDGCFVRLGRLLQSSGDG